MISASRWLLNPEALRCSVGETLGESHDHAEFPQSILGGFEGSGLMDALVLLSLMAEKRRAQSQREVGRQRLTFGPCLMIREMGRRCDPRTGHSIRLETGRGSARYPAKSNCCQSSPSLDGCQVDYPAPASLRSNSVKTHQGDPDQVAASCILGRGGLSKQLSINDNCGDRGGCGRPGGSCNVRRCCCLGC